ncbi:uncharacterized protein LOC119676366, partial [Teleopsis dalmanni]|uniref:uncharacterized protein LOC119676366 n=1 Tax=Teleopsis dalmanni TaxID=139649 RepID=UPI0018CD0AC1
MRENNGQLRGLLKKPNQPGAVRKNRVVFDETRNEFFDADYIILIREDCAYDEEDEETCTCGEHELVRLCCEEGCQCNYSARDEDTRTSQSPKYTPPIEFVDEAALSPPDGYKDNGLKNTLGGVLSSHIFGAQHIQQLQVIQRLQQQRAVMFAARSTNQISSSSAVLTSHQSRNADNTSPPSNVAMGAIQKPQQHSPDANSQGICTECAECAECAAKQLQSTE